MDLKLARGEMGYYEHEEQLTSDRSSVGAKGWMVDKGNERQQTVVVSELGCLK